MVVQVQTREHWCNKDHEVSHITNHSIPLGSSSSHHVSVPLESSLSYLLPINVLCYVNFQLKEILQPKLMECYSDLKQQGFAVLVKNIELNILNFLRMVDKETASISANHASQVEIFHLTLRNLNGLPHNSAASPRTSSKTNENTVLSIHVSHEAVNFIQKIIQQNSPGTFLGQNNSKEQYVIKFLLKSTPSWNDIAVHGNYIILRTPHENQVKFQVVQLPDSSGGVVINVYVSSEALRCSIHAALLHHLKVIVFFLILFLLNNNVKLPHKQSIIYSTN